MVHARAKNIVFRCGITSEFVIPSWGNQLFRDAAGILHIARNGASRKVLLVFHARTLVSLHARSFLIS